MVKYCGYYVTFQEVPNEVALVFTISNCPYRCEGCHSPWLQTDIGDELTPEVIVRLLDEYQGAITCVCFMGEGNDRQALGELIQKVHQTGIKICLYSGKDITTDLHEFMYIKHPIEYLKTGSYKKELGGLDSRKTNQRMWKLISVIKNEVGMYEDITSWFWRKKE